MSRPPLPPFTAESAAQKVRLAEGASSTRDPIRVPTGYSLGSEWRNPVELLTRRASIEAEEPR